MNFIAFVASAVALLATPGPTNTLLATAGASEGSYRSARLLLAELTGYLLAILALRTLLGPVVAAVPAFGLALRVAVVLYLLYLAAALWRHGAREARDAAPVTFSRVLVTTLLNPKAIIFAFTLLPTDRDAGLLPWLTALGLSIVTIGAGWILLGAMLRRGFSGRVPARIGYRCSAAALTLLAWIITSGAFLGV